MPRHKVTCLKPLRSSLRESQLIVLLVDCPAYIKFHSLWLGPDRTKKKACYIVLFVVIPTYSISCCDSPGLLSAIGLLCAIINH